MSTPDDVTDRPDGIADDAVPLAATFQAKPKKQHGFFRRHWIIVTLLVLIVLPVGGIFLWATSTLAYSFSEGTRAGYNQKLSHRGWLCKTWEGELAVSSVPGVAPQLFQYSVRSDSVAHAIQALEGQPVILRYAQHKGVPTSCFGDTEYYVTGVEKIGGR